jgi:tRNA isopentenyl-2-thiomethyl-A-37 hydroxylase MiaE
VPVSATEQTERSLVATECAFSVVRDIYYMKLMAVEVVSQLALDTIAAMPHDSAAFAELSEQIREELDHLNQCRLLLAEHGSFKARPDYVSRFARMMRASGGWRRRTLPLAVATILCISVERAAMRQLGAASNADAEICAMLKTLGTDEEHHYKLVGDVVAPGAAARASFPERMRSYLLMLRLTATTLLRWWPRQAPVYRTTGLDTDVFVEEVIDYAYHALRPLQVVFPRAFALRLARFSVRVS